MSGGKTDLVDLCDSPKDTNSGGSEGRDDEDAQLQLALQLSLASSVGGAGGSVSSNVLASLAQALLQASAAAPAGAGAGAGAGSNRGGMRGKLEKSGDEASGYWNVEGDGDILVASKGPSHEAEPPATPTPVLPLTLHVLTWNVWFSDTAWRVRTEAQLNLIKERRPVLVALQEVRLATAPLLRRGLESLGYNVCMQRCAVDEPTGYGVALASLAPLSNHSWHEFPESKMSRGVLHAVAKFKLGGNNSGGGGTGGSSASGPHQYCAVVVGTTHLESPMRSAATGWIDPTVSERQKQAATAFRVMNALAVAVDPSYACCASMGPAGTTNTATGRGPSKSLPVVGCVLLGDLNWRDDGPRGGKFDGPYPIPEGWHEAWQALDPADRDLAGAAKDGCTYDGRGNAMLKNKLRYRADRVFIAGRADGVPHPSSIELPSLSVQALEYVGTTAIPGVVVDDPDSPNPGAPVLPSDHYGVYVRVCSANTARSSRGSADLPGSSSGFPVGTSLPLATSGVGSSGSSGGGGSGGFCSAGGSLPPSGKAGPKYTPAQVPTKLKPKPAGGQRSILSMFGSKKREREESPTKLAAEVPKSGPHSSGYPGAASTDSAPPTGGLFSKRPRSVPTTSSPSLPGFRKQYSGVTLPVGWTCQGDSLLFRSFGDPSPSSRIAAFDFDNCLVKSSVTDRSTRDWPLQFDAVPNVLRQLHNCGFKIVVFTNEATIGRCKAEPAILRAVSLKTARLESFAKRLDGVPMQSFISAKKDHYRKGTGTAAWDTFASACNGLLAVSLPDSFFVGDAAGRPSDHGDGDKVFAEQVGLKFFVPEAVFDAAVTSDFMAKVAAGGVMPDRS